LKFVIPGPPIAQARPRLSMRGEFQHVYDPNGKDKKNTKNELLSLISQSSYTKPEGNISVSLVFKLPIPKTYTKKKNIDAINGILKPTKQDLDNLIKYILDASNSILWDDDRNIDVIHASKEFSQEPCTEIIIEQSIQRIPMEGHPLC
jgi:Holliday junction resolvase RusA-like endonuclease